MTTPARSGSFHLPNPLAPFGRSWRRLRRRPLAMQLRTAAIVIGVVVGLVVWLSLAPSAGAAESALAAAGGPTPVGQASTSTRGVTAHAINVVFPVVAINSEAGQLGFAEDKEYNEQTYAIHLYVNQINAAGGIHGRKINPIIVSYDPANATEMRSLCEQWTQGNPPVFAVIDGIGTWTGDNELCVTQEGQTPMIAAWTTTTNWTDQGSPYLWWTGADQAPVLKATVQWGVASGRLGKGKKVGVVVSDQAGDQAALHAYLLPDLKAVGISPQVYTVAAGLTETASTDSDAQLAVERLKAAGVQSVIPMLPENAFFPYIGAENQQKYFPQLLLSDYQSSIEVALGLIPVPYETALNGQEGVTTETLGGFDDDATRGSGWLRPGGALLLRHMAQGTPQAH